MMISARSASLKPVGFPYALDCGSWTAFQEWQKGIRPENILDVRAFEKAVAEIGPGADWIVLPDIVTGGLESLALSRLWLRRLRRRKALRGVKFALAVQNGMEPRHVRRLIGPNVIIFVGGDTEWKLRTLEQWARLAHDRGSLCHVGRVNTPRRIVICDRAGADSFDGSGVSRFIVTLPPLQAAIEEAHRQRDMFDHRADAA